MGATRSTVRSTRSHSLNLLIQIFYLLHQRFENRTLPGPVADDLNPGQKLSNRHRRVAERAIISVWTETGVLTPEPTNLGDDRIGLAQALAKRCALALCAL